ncbi:hypothetical protein Salat_2207000 [Sesamum alatum]|uniref:Uncharacterized protein n=1 Tax=Sesamum alatum TaxID=300844 RepID=A0AAE1XUT3_9LAMI|nr:hypothetical protein Salat_2207000 [Sesamum alatum]
MADLKSIEEGSAFPEKRKLDLPNPIDKTLEEKEEIKEEDKSDSNKRQKLETPTENENVIRAFTADEKITDVSDGEQDRKADENDNKEEHLEVEAEIADEEGIAAVDKGKGILIEESEDDYEEEGDEYDDSSDDSDSDFSDGLDSDSEGNQVY